MDPRRHDWKKFTPKNSNQQKLSCFLRRIGQCTFYLDRQPRPYIIVTFVNKEKGKNSLQTLKFMINDIEKFLSSLNPYPTGIHLEMNLGDFQRSQIPVVKLGFNHHEYYRLWGDRLDQLVENQKIGPRYTWVNYTSRLSSQIPSLPLSPWKRLALDHIAKMYEIDFETSKKNLLGEGEAEKINVSSPSHTEKVNVSSSQQTELNLHTIENKIEQLNIQSESKIDKEKTLNLVAQKLFKRAQRLRSENKQHLISTIANTNMKTESNGGDGSLLFTFLIDLFNKIIVTSQQTSSSELEKKQLLIEEMNRVPWEITHYTFKSNEEEQMTVIMLETVNLHRLSCTSDNWIPADNELIHIYSELLNITKKTESSLK